jgi:DNA-binding response OmpR family regulator
MTKKASRPAYVLVVDDEPAICSLLTDTLRSTGLEVAGVTTAQEAMYVSARQTPDLVIADMRLGDGSGLDLIDRLRASLGDVPAVIITGQGDMQSMSDASRRRPVEVLAKPLDLGRLCQTVQDELRRQDKYRRVQTRQRRLRELTRNVTRQRRRTYQALCTTCTDLTTTCRKLQGQMDRQESLISYQTDLLACASEDDIFRRLFRAFVDRSGAVHGVALLCDENAELQIVGRFGVPSPDGVAFCQALTGAVVPGVLERPEVRAFDAYENLQLFPETLHRSLVGVSLLIIPLLIGQGQLIGLVTLYRKGEQPFTDDDVALAELVAPATAAAVQKV